MRRRKIKPDVHQEYLAQVEHFFLGGSYSVDGDAVLCMRETARALLASAKMYRLAKPRWKGGPVYTADNFQIAPDKSSAREHWYGLVHSANALLHFIRRVSAHDRQA